MKKYMILLTIVAILLSGCMSQPEKTTEKTTTISPSVTITTSIPISTSTPTFIVTPKPTSKIPEGTETKDLLPKTISGYSIIDTETIISPGNKYPKFSNGEEVSYVILSPLNNSEKEFVEFVYIAVHRYANETGAIIRVSEDMDLTGYPAKILSRWPSGKRYDPKLGSGTEFSSHSYFLKRYKNYVFQKGIVAKMDKRLMNITDTIFENIDSSWNEYRQVVLE